MIDPKSAPAAPSPKNQPSPAKARASLDEYVENVRENIAILDASIVTCQEERDRINADIAAHRTEIAEWRRMLPRKRTPKTK